MPIHDKSNTYRRHSTKNVIVSLAVLLLVAMSTNSFGKSTYDANNMFKETAMVEEYSDDDALGAYGDENDEYVFEEDVNTKSILAKQMKPAATIKQQQQLSFEELSIDNVDLELTRPGYGSQWQDDDA